MFDTATSWLMTGLNPDPLMVSAVQVATMAPMFLMTIPAGALADVVDPRRLLIAAQVGVAAVGAVFAALVAAHLASAPGLLAATFLLGAAGALAAPAWQIVTPMLVPRPELDEAIAVSNAGYNVSRAIGPALGGVAITAVGIRLPFWIYVGTNLVVLAALMWWRPPRKAPETLPAERLVAAVASGLRYARNNRDLDATLIRALAFFPVRERLLGADAADRARTASRRRRALRPAHGHDRPRIGRRLRGPGDAEGAPRPGPLRRRRDGRDRSRARPVRSRADVRRSPWLRASSPERPGSWR